MQNVKNGICGLAVLLGAAGAAQAVTIEVIPARLPQSGPLTPMQGSKSVAAGLVVVTDAARQVVVVTETSAALCACTSLDNTLIAGSCGTAEASSRLSADTGQARDTLAVLASSLQTATQPISVPVSGAGMTPVTFPGQLRTIQQVSQIPPDTILRQADTGIGLGGGGAQVMLTATPAPSSTNGQVPTLSPVPLPATGLLLCGALAGAIGLRRRMRPKRT
ncbi:MAG: VPLPA-CTERM sorting domain-containing protein [Alphaproteobacteria bacterium]|nr:VPLPA-CTERM sorting domain-containing protein [Alphaproteobacteria bacterium]